MNEHKVKFDFGIMSGKIVSILVEDGEYLKKIKSPSRDDAIFLGWYHDEAWIYPWDFDHDIVIEDITLYAKWQTNRNKIELSNMPPVCNEKYMYVGSFLAELSEIIQMKN